MRTRLALLFIISFLFSCSDKDKVATNFPPVPQFTFQDDLDKIRLDGSGSTDPDHDPLTFNWSASSSKLEIKSIDNPSYSYFKIPQATSEETVIITLKVRDQSHESVSTQSILVPVLTKVRSFGLGKELGKEVSNNDPYEWYYDQGFTGTSSLVNCGPTAVTMAIKWVTPDFQGTPLDARNTYKPNGGWWQTYDIINYLGNYSINNWTIPLDNMESLKGEIDKGNIAILCLDMYYVAFLTPEVDSEYRKSKFYATESEGWGHFIVVKGYKEVDGVTFFEAYDPYTFGNKYADLTPKGKDRYYTSDNLDKATQVWWDFAIIVSKNAFPGGRRIVNTSEIKHMPGR